jgi:hypothetical protein
VAAEGDGRQSWKEMMGWCKNWDGAPPAGSPS